MAQTVQLYTMHAATIVTETVQSCCTCISERVQAIWNAFCLLITDYVKPAFTWCVSWFSSAPTAPAAPVARAEPIEKRDPYMMTLIGVRKQNGSEMPSYLDFCNDLRNLRIRSQTEKFGKWADKNYALHMMANPRYAKADSNATEDLIRLGANPNAVNEYGYTPLHCAVLSGSFLAYKTLRGLGADPTLAAKRRVDFDSFEPGTPIELAYKIKESEFEVHINFWSLVMNGGRYFLRELFPENLMAPGKNDEVGTKADINQMIAYEEGYQKEMVEKAAPIVGEVCGVPPSLAKMIAEMGKYYI